MFYSFDFFQATQRAGMGERRLLVKEKLPSKDYNGLKYELF
jgi:hypothetical protein